MVGRAARGLGKGIAKGLKAGGVKAIDIRIKAVGGRGVKTVGGRRVAKVGRAVRGSTGREGRVGRPVKPINRRTMGADDIFDPLS